jgi:hypothetical protein
MVDKHIKIVELDVYVTGYIKVGDMAVDVVLGSNS